MATSRKKVVVRRFSPGFLLGYLPATGLLDDTIPGFLPLLDLAGKVLSVPLTDVKYIAYVRDFNASDAEPERLLRKTFAMRPRNEGLWVRLTLRDGDELEGLAALDLSFADGWREDGGVFLAPPDTRGNTQRLFVARAAVGALEIVAVVTTPTRRQAAKQPGPEDRQTDLFAAL